MADVNTTTININLDSGNPLLVRDTLLRQALRNTKEEELRLPLKNTEEYIRSLANNKIGKYRIATAPYNTKYKFATAPYNPEEAILTPGPQPTLPCVSLLPEGRKNSFELIGRSLPSGGPTEDDSIFFPGLRTGSKIFRITYGSAGGNKEVEYLPDMGPFGAPAWAGPTEAEKPNSDFGGITKRLPQFDNIPLTKAGDQTTEFWTQFLETGYNYDKPGLVYGTAQNSPGTIPYWSYYDYNYSPMIAWEIQKNANYNSYNVPSSSGGQVTVLDSYLSLGITISVPITSTNVLGWTSLQVSYVMHYHTALSYNPVTGQLEGPSLGPSASILNSDPWPHTVYQDLPEINHNEWFHCAVVNLGNTGTFYINGKKIVSWSLYIDENRYVLYQLGPGSIPAIRCGGPALIYGQTFKERFSNNGIYKYPASLAVRQSGFRWVPRAVYNSEFTPRKPVAGSYP